MTRRSATAIREAAARTTARRAIMPLWSKALRDLATLVDIAVAYDATPRWDATNGDQIVAWEVHEIALSAIRNLSIDSSEQDDEIIENAIENLHTFEQCTFPLPGPRMRGALREAVRSLMAWKVEVAARFPK